MKVACDICESRARVYLDTVVDHPAACSIAVCGDCGFVYVPERRSASDIAQSWTEEIFGSGYTSAVPYVRARLRWVSEVMQDTLSLAGRRIVDVGAGEGLLMTYLAQASGGTADLWGVEPSLTNCETIRELGFQAIPGTLEEVTAGGALSGTADIVTVTWTLENCADCNVFLDYCRRLLTPAGALVIATGSRLLVPFKKPLGDYLTTERHPDTHAFRFSRASLVRLLARHGFAPVYENRWRDSDWMLIIASPSQAESLDSPPGDDPAKVLEFFARWEAFDQWLAAPR